MNSYVSTWAITMSSYSMSVEARKWKYLQRTSVEVMGKEVSNTEK